MNLLKMKIKHKAKQSIELSADEKGMLTIYDKPTDFTNRKYINNIIAYIKS